jgi:hypothetical protein
LPIIRVIVDRMLLTAENGGTTRKPVSVHNFVHHRCIGLRSNMGFPSKRPATNLLSHSRGYFVKFVDNTHT